MDSIPNIEKKVTDKNGLENIGRFYISAAF
jgi:hypothetical protein